MAETFRLFPGEPAPTQDDSPHQWARLAHDFAADPGLTDEEYRVLGAVEFFLRQGDSTNATDDQIARRCAKQRRAVTRLIGSLVKKGKLVRCSRGPVRTLTRSFNLASGPDRPGPTRHENAVSTRHARAVLTARPRRLDGTAAPSTRHERAASLDVETKRHSETAGAGDRPLGGGPPPPRKTKDDLPPPCLNDILDSEHFAACTQLVRAGGATMGVAVARLSLMLHNRATMALANGAELVFRE